MSNVDFMVDDEAHFRKLREPVPAYFSLDGGPFEHGVLRGFRFKREGHYFPIFTLDSSAEAKFIKALVVEDSPANHVRVAAINYMLRKRAILDESIKENRALLTVVDFDTEASRK